MHVTVRFFARLRDIVGQAELDRSTVQGATVADVWQGLAAEYPELAPLGAAVSSAVNADYAKMTRRLQDGDEIAFLPPVSGG